MEFCEFAKLLYQYIGSGQMRGEFVANLCHNIMQDPEESDKEKLDEDSQYYPLDGLEEDTLGRYFSGSRSLSGKTVGKILSCLDKVRFIEFIAAFPVDTQTLIEAALKERGMDVPDGEGPEACADLFASILQDCISKPRNRRKKPPEKQPSQADQARDVPEAETASVRGGSTGGAQLYIEDAYKCCRFCRRWKGAVADILDDCMAYKEKREATDGKGCKYYVPHEGRITVQMLVGSKGE